MWYAPNLRMLYTSECRKRMDCKISKWHECTFYLTQCDKITMAMTWASLVQFVCVCECMQACSVGVCFCMCTLCVLHMISMSIHVCEW